MSSSSRGFLGLVATETGENPTTTTAYSVLPGDLTTVAPATARGRVLLALAGDLDPALVAKRANSLRVDDHRAAAMALIKAGDGLLLAGDPDAASFYRRAAIRALCDRQLNAVALYGQALVAYGRGDAWAALGKLEEAQEQHDHPEISATVERIAAALLMDAPLGGWND